MSSEFYRKKSQHWLVVPDGDIATTRILACMWRAIEARHPNIRFTQRLSSKVCADDLDGITGVFFCRACDPQILPFWETVKERGLPTIFYLDDNFFLLTVRPPLSDLYQRPEFLLTLKTLIAGCDRVMVNNHNMGEYLRPLNPHIFYTPGFLDMDLLGLTAVCHPTVKNPGTSPVVIGFLSERSKADDYAPVLAALNTLEKEKAAHGYFPPLQLECFGPVPEALKTFQNVRSLDRIDDYGEFLRFKQSCNWTFGLAPLALWPFNRFKTNNKFREFGGCGIIGLYSGMQALDNAPDAPQNLSGGPYDSCVKDGVNGFLVADHTEAAWLKVLCRALSLTPLERQRIQEQALVDVRENYSLDAALPAWRDVLYGVNLPV